MPPTLFVAIPAFNEFDFLPQTLNCLAAQQINAKFEVFVCVNQPENFWHNQETIHVCRNNERTLQFLKNYEKLTLHVIDKSSQGLGWDEKKSGVGFARKILIDTILEKADNNDIIVSLDSDTLFEPSYLHSLYDNFLNNKKTNAISVPYYHKIDKCDEECARAILRYEIYMRNYLINLLKINSPYAFTALGSAIAIKVGSLSQIGGITPYQSGEDFYLLQKIVKMGGLSIFNSNCVYPSPRVSNRVPFGTGPAVSKGISGISESYPIYHHSDFAPIGLAYNNLEKLYNTLCVEDNAFLEFINAKDKNKDVWKNIRNNVSDFNHFEKGFHQKADGLKILQFVRNMHDKNNISDEISLLDNLKLWFPKMMCIDDNFDFRSSSLETINNLRDFLFQEEMKLRAAQS